MPYLKPMTKQAAARFQQAACICKLTDCDRRLWELGAAVFHLPECPYARVLEFEPPPLSMVCGTFALLYILRYTIGAGDRQPTWRWMQDCPHPGRGVVYDPQAPSPADAFNDLAATG